MGSAEHLSWSAVSPATEILLVMLFSHFAACHITLCASLLLSPLYSAAAAAA